MQRNSFNPPVQVGEEVDVRIEAVGEKGDGVARVKGFVLFVPQTKEGEQCRIRVTKVLSKLGFAEKIGAAGSGSSGSSGSSSKKSSSAPRKEESRRESKPAEPVEEAPDAEVSDSFGEDLEEEY